MSLKKSIVLFGIVVAPFLFASEPQHNEHKAEHKVHWGYEGEATKWDKLDAENFICSMGKRQSPVDIESSKTKKLSLQSIFFDYKPTNLEIVNNGHTIQINVSNGSMALIGGKEYKLLQFHFHAPSEHTVDSKSYPMEAHLVHKAEDGELAVIGVFMDLKEHSEFFETIFANMPKEANKTFKSDSLKIDVTDILPNDRKFYHYIGSLTTPPCTQIVEWYVMKTPVYMSQKQFKSFEAIYKNNARPIQPLFERAVIEQQ